MIRRIVARVRGEIRAQGLAPYRRAGVEVARLFERLEDAEDAWSWSRPPHVQASALCAWNAFVRQTTADRLIDTDYLARDTAAQARELYEGVRVWLARAREAEANPGYPLDVHVPEALPRLLDQEYTRSELHGLRGAAQTVHAYATDIAETLGRTSSAEHDACVARLRQIVAATQAALDYAETLWSRDPERDVALTLGTELVEALALAHLVGQLGAMPVLLAEPDAQETAARRVPPLPGQPGFDPWRLTDPQTAARLRPQFGPVAQLAKLWDDDPDPARTLALQLEVERAVESGAAQRLPPGTTAIGAMSKSCPWPSVHVALRSIALGGANIPEMHSFAISVGVHEGSFRRAVVVGPRIYVPKPPDRTGGDGGLDVFDVLGGVSAALIDF